MTLARPYRLKAFTPDGGYLGEIELSEHDLGRLRAHRYLRRALSIKRVAWSSDGPIMPPFVPTVCMRWRQDHPARDPILIIEGDTERLAEQKWFWDTAGKRAWREAEQQAMDAAGDAELARRRCDAIAAAKIAPAVRFDVERLAWNELSKVEARVDQLRRRAEMIHKARFPDEALWLGTMEYCD